MLRRYGRLALRIVLDDREIDASETTTVFTILGTMSFAALLPFGLLLYKSGPLGMSMMYLAPLVTLWGLPMLATGTILWRRINNKELVASRTTGTALGILGVMIVLAGMMLAWPNPPASCPRHCLTLRSSRRLPLRSTFACLSDRAICFALAYLVTCHVVVGNITWQNLRVMSLLDVSLSVASGQVLVGAFALFVIASEWLSQRRRERDSYYYLISACLIGVVSLALATLFGFEGVEYHPLWIVYGLYSLGAFWIAWRHKLLPFTWIGSALLLFSLAHGFAYALSFSFPWQTCAVCTCDDLRGGCDRQLTIQARRGSRAAAELQRADLDSARRGQSVSGEYVGSHVDAGAAGFLDRRDSSASALAHRRRLILNAFQIALICALVLTVKQRYSSTNGIPTCRMRSCIRRRCKFRELCWRCFV